MLRTNDIARQCCASGGSSPIFLDGKPPLPGPLEYTEYVSSLEGHINPYFLQEKVIDMADFAVPFQQGTLRCRKWSCSSSEESSENEDGCLGVLWEREVDEEMRRIETLQPKKKSKRGGEKRTSEEVK